MRIMLADSIRGIVSQQLIPSASGSGAELALEVLLNNTSVRKCIVDNKTFQLGSIIQTGQKQGMVGMVDSVRALVEQGKVSKEIAQRYVRQSL
jgi:twitching motility protein PilT